MPAVVQNYSGFGYAGCFADNATRLYGTPLRPANNSVEACLDAARTGNYSAAGIGNGGERRWRALALLL